MVTSKLIIGIMGLTATTMNAEDNLNQKVEELTKAFRSLEGYHARHEIVTEEEKRAHFECGLDQESGRGVAAIGFTDEEGKSVTQWATDGGGLVLSNEKGEIIVFENFGKLMEGIEQLGNVFFQKDNRKDLLLSTNALLTIDSVNGSIGYCTPTQKPDWLADITAIASEDEKTVTLNRGESGQVVVARETGILLQLSFHTPKGKREMKLVVSTPSILGPMVSRARLGGKGISCQ